MLRLAIRDSLYQLLGEIEGVGDTQHHVDQRVCSTGTRCGGKAWLVAVLVRLARRVPMRQSLLWLGSVAWLLHLVSCAV